MNNHNNYTRFQLVFILLLRFATGWHLLYEGVAKLLNPAWSSAGFLQESQWLLSGFARWVVSDPAILNAVDFLNTWGLIAIGLGLIMGMFFRLAAVSGAVLLLVYYLNCPPLVGLEYSIPRDGNNLIVDKTLIEAIALMVLALFPTSKVFGIDALISRFKKKGGEND
ncbi:DoxX family membrane protein [Gaoshiqia sp. Z1-71]|uniref:DoxX family membrane protein n=1 Tax=Gaoshiqia hydrogeniformans TaxID=3290090 RepID=UPI003BF88061